MTIHFVATIVAALCLFAVNNSAANLSDLHDYLERDVLGNRNAAPVGPNQEPVSVQFGIFLVNIADADVTKKEIEIDVWLHLQWNSSIQWTPANFNDIDSVLLPGSSLWLPDMSVYEGVSKLSNIEPDSVIINNAGMATYIPKVRVRSNCDIDSYRLARDVNCTLTFGFWATSDNVANMTNMDPLVNTDYYAKGSRYEYLGTSFQRSAIVYGHASYSHFKVSLSFKEKIPSPVMNGCVQGAFSMH